MLLRNTYFQLKPWTSESNSSQKNKGEKKKSCLRLLLLPLQLLQHGLELLLLLLGLLDGCLVLLIVSHGHHGQDQVDQVEGAQEDDQHEEDHVGFPRSSQSLMDPGGGGHERREEAVVRTLI